MKNLRVTYNLFLCEYLSKEYGVRFKFDTYESLNTAIDSEIISDLFFGHLYKNFFIKNEPDKIRLLWADEEISRLNAEINSLNATMLERCNLIKQYESEIKPLRFIVNEYQTQDKLNTMLKKLKVEK